MVERGSVQQDREGALVRWKAPAFGPFAVGEVARGVSEIESGMYVRKM
jgi:hypothetical protein